MNIQIEKRYKVRIPIDIGNLIRKLLNKIPKEHLYGLGTIILVNQLTHKRNQKSEGLYWQRKGEAPAKIEIAVDTIYKGMPSFIFYLPFIAKFMLADVLYHEIGHHYQYSIHGITNKAGDNFAEKYKKQMLKKTFLWWRLLFLPLLPLVQRLTSVAQKRKAQGHIL